MSTLLPPSKPTKCIKHQKRERYTNSKSSNAFYPLYQQKSTVQKISKHLNFLVKTKQKSTFAQAPSKGQKPPTS